MASSWIVCPSRMQRTAPATRKVACEYRYFSTLPCSTCLLRKHGANTTALTCPACQPIKDSVLVDFLVRACACARCQHLVQLGKHDKHLDPFRRCGVTGTVLPVVPPCCVERRPPRHSPCWCPYAKCDTACRRHQRMRDEKKQHEARSMVEARRSIKECVLKKHLRNFMYRSER